jgi:hypothetical protein
MRIFLLLITAALLISCGSSGKDYAIRDPIFEDEQNYIIFHEDGGKSYMMKDPIFADEDNWILFREQK